MKKEEEEEEKGWVFDRYKWGMISHNSYLPPYNVPLFFLYIYIYKLNQFYKYSIIGIKLRKIYKRN